MSGLTHTTKTTHVIVHRHTKVTLQRQIVHISDLLSLDVYFGTALWQTQSQAPVEEKQRQMCEHDDTHVCMLSYGRPHTFVHMSECETGTRGLLKMRVLFACQLGFALAHIHLFKSQQLEDAWLSHLLPALIISDQKELQHRRGFIFPTKTAAVCCGFTPWHSKHLGSSLASLSASAQNIWQCTTVFQDSDH